MPQESKLPFTYFSIVYGIPPAACLNTSSLLIISIIVIPCRSYVWAEARGVSAQISVASGGDGDVGCQLEWSNLSDGLLRKRRTDADTVWVGPRTFRVSL